MDPRATFARMFSPNAGDFQFPRTDVAALQSSDLQETYPRGDAGDYGAPRRVGGHHFGSPAMQSFFVDQGIGVPAPAAAGEVSFVQAMQSMANASPTLAPTVASTTIQRSLVDEYGSRIQDAPPPLQYGSPRPPPDGENQQGQELPADRGRGESGSSTTTMLLFGGAAFLAVMLLLKKGKK